MCFMRLERGVERLRLFMNCNRIYRNMNIGNYWVVLYRGGKRNDRL